MDWGMLGYFVGDVVQEHIPVARRQLQRPRSSASSTSAPPASSSGGVEMYHIVGVTPEAPTVEMAFGPNRPVETFTYGAAERAARLRRAQCQRHAIPDVDYVMLGCPHAALEQLREAATLLERQEGQRATASSGSSRRAPCSSEARRGWDT